MESLTFISCFEKYQGTITDISTNTVISSDYLKKLERKCVYILKNHGIKKLERVALVVKSPVTFIINFFAIIEIGAIPVLLPKMTTEYELSNYDRLYGIHWVIKDDDEICEYSVDMYQWYIKQVNKSAIYLPELKDMILQPTSGSTDSPKICVRDAYGCFAEPQNHVETTSFADKSTIYCPLALNHAYGFGTAFLLAFITSSNLILENEMSPRKILQVFSNYNVTMFTGVPVIYELLAKMIIHKEVVMPDQLLSAGAPLLQNISEAFYERFHKYIHTSYGSTETGEMCIELEDVITKTGCVGQPLKYTSIQFEKGDSDYNHVVVSNPSMMVGYLSEDGSIDKSMFRQDRVFCTGDLGKFDSDGRVYLSGRENNMINVFGIKVNSYEVETAIREITEISDVHVYPGRHLSGSEVVLAIVSVNKAIGEQEIINRCKEKLLPHKVPVKVFLVDKLPRNQSGKIIKVQLPNL